MKKQSRTTPYFKKIILAIVVTFCWVTAASANLISYNITIGDFISEDPLYTGVAVLNTDTHVLLPGDDFTLGHTYEFSYELESTDGVSSYSGGGSLHLSVLLDIYVYLDGFANYMTEGPAPIFDPEPTGWVWHDPDFDVTSLQRLSANEMPPPSVSSSLTHITMEQVQGASVPEPSVLLLMASGLIGLGFVRRKKILKT